jgi:hypothetical protein
MLRWVRYETPVMVRVAVEYRVVNVVVGVEHQDSTPRAARRYRPPPHAAQPRS